MPTLRLRPVADARRGQEVVFSGPRVRIGRSRDNDLILPQSEAPQSSGHHAEIVLNSTGSWSIVDLKSSNGTRLNDVVVERHDLRNGDRLTFGDQEFIVEIGASPSGRRSVWLAGAAAFAMAAVLAGLLLRSRGQRSFEDIATTASKSVFMIAVEENGMRATVGTAFAITADGLLATNAHVVGALRKRGALPAGQGAARALAVLGDSYAVRAVVSASMHPAWHEGSLEGDVALVRLAPGPPLVPLRIADAATMAALRRGAAIAAFGFPAVSTDALRPRGRLSVDVIGDIRGDYFEVGLGIAPGTSGSPIFNSSGAVIAIVAGGDFVDAPTGARPTGSAANWALSVVSLRQVPPAY